MHNKKNGQNEPGLSPGNLGLLSRVAMAPLLAIAAMAPVGATAQPDIVDIAVTFNGKCPVSVDKFDVDVNSKPPQRVRWTAYDQDGAPMTDVVYDIYFDPFVGPSLADSNKDGVVTSPPVSSKVLTGVDYKYTIAGRECDTPLDPRLRVR